MYASRELRELLADWTDIDVAQHRLGVVLGLIPRNAALSTATKHLFWTSNPIGDALASILESLAVAAVLERREEPDIQYRWRATVPASAVASAGEGMSGHSALVIASAVVAVDPSLELADAVGPAMSAALDALRAIPGAAASRARYTELDPASANCGRCVRCGAWVTDRTRAGAMPDLPNGATHDGELLCDEHLPKDHRWAF